jgi:hypothetical protein
MRMTVTNGSLTLVGLMDLSAPDAVEKSIEEMKDKIFNILRPWPQYG